jgi:parallel beta-helix repeat protein
MRVMNSADAGISVINATNAVITGSTVLGSWIGILLGIPNFGAPDAQVTNSTVIGNLAWGIELANAEDAVLSRVEAITNAADGIRVGALSVGTEIRNSTASSNSENGISMHTATGKLTGNTLARFPEWTVVTDGGGNKAHDNGSVHQCENIACG